MTRLYGRAFGGERVVEYVPDVRYETTAILSSVRLSGDTVPVIFEGALNGKTFKTYIEKSLVPALLKDDIVIMDSLSSHKVKGIVEAVETAGASVVFLPEYSPDLNPIELMWSKIKSGIRSLKPRSQEELEIAIALAFEAVSPDDVSAWFEYCGYMLKQPVLSVA
jgi:transposase